MPRKFFMSEITLLPPPLLFLRSSAAFSFILQFIVAKIVRIKGCSAFISDVAFYIHDHALSSVQALAFG